MGKSSVLSFGLLCQLLLLSVTLAVRIENDLGEAIPVGVPYRPLTTFTTSVTAMATSATLSSLVTNPADSSPKPTCSTPPYTRGSTCSSVSGTTLEIGTGIAAGFIGMLVAILIAVELHKRVLRKRQVKTISSTPSLAADHASLEAPPPPYTKTETNAVEMQPLPASREGSPPLPSFTAAENDHEEQATEEQS
ncbi:MAG: hypothetical protein MMC33_007639 [Icmadophila ericetorum]|nr:hypothetical protein [Icmadophila ericetorum]